MASHLLVLKSRSLLPRDVPVEEDDLDPRLDLVKQLLAYKRFKDAAGELGGFARVQEGRFPVRASAADVEPHDELIEADLYSLVAAFRKLLRETGRRGRSSPSRATGCRSRTSSASSSSGWCRRAARSRSSTWSGRSPIAPT